MIDSNEDENWVTHQKLDYEYHTTLIPKQKHYCNTKKNRKYVQSWKKSFHSTNTTVKTKINSWQKAGNILDWDDIKNTLHRATLRDSLHLAS